LSKLAIELNQSRLKNLFSFRKKLIDSCVNQTDYIMNILLLLLLLDYKYISLSSLQLLTMNTKSLNRVKVERKRRRKKRRRLRRRGETPSLNDLRFNEINIFILFFFYFRVK